ncbi:MAG: hypothetical protein V9E81_04340 [Marmoricola sp.]
MRAPSALEQANEARDAVLEKLLDGVDVPVPDGLLASQVESRRADVERQLGWAGMTLQQYLDNQKQTEDEFDGEIEKQVRDGIAAQFILDEIAKKEEINVEENELSEALWMRAQQSGQDPNEFVKHMVEHNHIPELVAEIVRGKALGVVVAAASVKDASGNAVDLGEAVATDE